MATKNRKHELRSEMLARRRRLNVGFRQQASETICRHIARSAFFRSAKSVAVYHAFSGEVDLAPLTRLALRAHKRVFLPVLLGNRGRRLMRFSPLEATTPLARNRFGILEPRPSKRTYAAPRTLDVVLTPLVAFDRHGHRLGLGAGYYDRCFSFLLSRGGWRRPKLVGVAYSFQETETIPPDPWDVRLWRAVTEKGIRRPRDR